MDSSISAKLPGTPVQTFVATFSCILVMIVEFNMSWIHLDLLG